jgi:hypothetical protein
VNTGTKVTVGLGAFMLIGIGMAFTQKGEGKTKTRIEINQEVESAENWYDDDSS